MSAWDCTFYNKNIEFLPACTFKLVGKNLNWEGMGPLVLNINIKLMLIAVVRMYCCTPKMLKETE